MNIKRSRGDTFPIEIAVTNSAGTAVDVTGFSFVLTVDPENDPTSSAANLFQLTGVITDASAGEVQFVPSPAQADQTPEIYFYDIQMTDGSGRIRTIASGRFEVVQDITK